ncbi:MAG: O-antigen ligase family protein, partial [Actinomycetota bacterium]|nr:O-antigen ligase family protein [Actinomycetota bacterium]
SEHAGRIYLVSLLTLVIFVAGYLSLLQQPGQLPPSLILIPFGILLFAGILYRPGSGQVFTWAFRPLQPILMAVGVILLLRASLPSTIVRLQAALLVTGVAGCLVGILNALWPRFDPFAFARPADLPYQSAVINFHRATGSFVYPTVFGLFAAYVAIVGLNIGVTGFNSSQRPTRNTVRLGTVAFLAGFTACLLSASRAAIGALVVGAIVTTFQARLRAPSKRIVLPFLAGVAILFTLVAQPAARTVVNARIEDAYGQSLAFRVENTRFGWDAFLQAPFFGSGVTQSRLDNGYLLYLDAGGLIGFMVLGGLFCAVIMMRRPTEPQALALLVVLLAASTLEDALGQTLSSWYLGLAVGLSVARALASDNRDASDPGPRRFDSELAIGSKAPIVSRSVR